MIKRTSWNLQALCQRFLWATCWDWREICVFSSCWCRDPELNVCISLLDISEWFKVPIFIKIADWPGYNRTWFIGIVRLTWSLDFVWSCGWLKFIYCVLYILCSMQTRKTKRKTWLEKTKTNLKSLPEIHFALSSCRKLKFFRNLL